jgi:hypothetical protein
MPKPKGGERKGDILVVLKWDKGVLSMGQMEWKCIWRGVKPYSGTDALYNIDRQRCLLSGDSDQPKENSHYLMR